LEHFRALFSLIFLLDAAFAFWAKRTPDGRNEFSRGKSGKAKTIKKKEN
jgi:hypothetical protein